MNYHALSQGKMMLNELAASVNLIVTQTRNNLDLLLKIISIPWAIFFINAFLGHRLWLLGIFPRKIYGLPGILCAPILHANFNHIFFNTIPLVVLTNFLLINGLSFYLDITLKITLISGALIWCFAKPGLHIGASALITGYWGFLVVNIYNTGTITAIILGIVSLYYFIGIFIGIFPSEKGVSWEGHLFGLLAGAMVSFLMI